MTYTAKAALPFPDAHRAVSDLRGQLRLLLSDDGRSPYVETLRITEPVEVIGAHVRVATSGPPPWRRPGELRRGRRDGHRPHGRRACRHRAGRVARLAMVPTSVTPRR